MLIQSEHDGHYLTFDDEKHAYILDGKQLPGVTTINKHGFPPAHNLIVWMIKQGSWFTVESLKEYPEQVNKLPNYLLDEIVKKSTSASKKVAKAAADIGSLVHDYCEQFEFTGMVDTQLVERIRVHVDKEKIDNCISQFIKWKEENKDEIIGHEEIIASPKFGFAGKFDRLARRGKSIILSDFKTSGAIHTEHFIQLAAYGILLKEWKGIEIDGIEVLRFGKGDAEFETKLIKNKKHIKEYENQFIRNLETMKFKEEFE